MKSFFILLVALFCLGIGVGKAQYKVLLDFNDTNGTTPYGSLVGFGNKLYGMATGGGAYGDGLIFSINTNGSGYKDLFDFDGTTGKWPNGSLTLSGGILYGMASQGGLHLNEGCIFSIDTDGSGYSDIYNFTGGANGANPSETSLIISGYKLYGMTRGGGLYSYGNIFSLDTNGSAYKDLLDFDYTNGAGPIGSLTLSGNKLFGMTIGGGVGPADTFGCIFSIDTNGNGYKVLWNFLDTGTNGAYPWGDLTVSGYKMYGMTNGGGGVNTYGCIFSIDTNGNGYKVLHGFNYIVDSGAFPLGSLILSDGVLLGMTQSNIFSIDTNGSRYIDLWNFHNTGTNGDNPYGYLTLLGDELFGMTNKGGTKGDGVIFSLKDTNGDLGINQLRASLAPITIYPNPNPGIFTIQSSVVSGQLSVEIYNVLGEKILRQTLVRTGTGGLRSTQDDNRIELNQPNGVYFYRVLEEDGSIVGSGKVIIQK